MNNLDLSRYQTLEVGVKANKGEARNQTEEIINKFVEKINEDRKSQETKEYNIKRWKEWCKVNKQPVTIATALMFKETRYYIGLLDYKAIVGILYKRGYRSNYDRNILLQECLRAKSFSACFWSKIKK